MAEFDYNKREKQWVIYRRLEAKQKKSFLPNLSEKDGFKILKELHRFAHKLGTKPRAGTLDMAKVEALAKVHSMFGNVKA